jgi:oligopeptide transport system ATP-binding protein
MNKVDSSGGNGVLLEVDGLKKYFPIRSGFFSRIVGYLKAVDGVSFAIRKGETLGLVGESGCGKTTLARVILRLSNPTSGEVYFDHIPVFSLKKNDMRKLRKRMQIIFQDPFGSLNPRLTIGGMISEAIKIHKLASGDRVREKVVEILDRVGIPSEHIGRYPHEFSGGQRQRIGIARALAVNPDLVIADEPVSALDVSIQAQIINLLRDLQKDLGLTFLFIAHDLSLVEYISDRIAVMYLGKLVELTGSDELYTSPRHPYSQALLSAIPSLDPSKKSERILLSGDIPSPAMKPPGCSFHTRCPYVKPICRKEEPPFREIEKDHSVSCWLYEE